VREKSSNSAVNPSTRFSRLPCRNAFALTPYSAIFCRPSSRCCNRNHKKANSLQKSAQNSSPKYGANPLFHNILRVSHCSSIFCLESRGYGIGNINGMNILQNCEEKNWKVCPAPSCSARDASFRLKGGYAQDDAPYKCTSITVLVELGILLPIKKGGPREAAFPFY
jgi:hypothetical protein